MIHEIQCSADRMTWSTLCAWTASSAAGAGLITSTFALSRWLPHKTRIPGEGFRDIITASAGHSGVWLGMAAFVSGYLLYLLLLGALCLLIWGCCAGSRLANYSVFFVMRLKGICLLVIPAIAAMVAQPPWIPVIWISALGIIAVVVFLTVMRVPEFLADRIAPEGITGRFQRSAALGLAGVIGVGVSSSLGCLDPGSGNAFVKLPNSLCLLSFDCEEDWQGKESTVQGDVHPGESCYLGTFDYVTSGYLNQLVGGLASRKIRATFYCTPNLAKEHPEALQKILTSGHEVAVHLHPHQARKVNYPYVARYDKDLCGYPKNDVFQMISNAKKSVESATGVQTKSFRSGEWACDAGIENILSRTGFQSFSNHDSTFQLGNGMWQVATRKDFDMLKSPELMLLQIMKKKDDGTIIPCFSHPMVGFDHVRKEPNFEGLNQYFAMLDLAIKRCPNVRFATTSEAVDLIRETTPSIQLRSILVVAFVVGNLSLVGASVRIVRRLN
ncbi:MAG: polysaccharide deacetylase family protein [Verrucomicrobiota bacterium]